MFRFNSLYLLELCLGVTTQVAVIGSDADPVLGKDDVVVNPLLGNAALGVFNGDRLNIYDSIEDIYAIVGHLNTVYTTKVQDNAILDKSMMGKIQWKVQKGAL